MASSDSFACNLSFFHETDESSSPKASVSSILVELIFTEVLPVKVAPDWLSKDITVQAAKALLVSCCYSLP